MVRAKTVVLLLLLMSLALAGFSQTAAQTTTPDSAQSAKSCACCNHNNASGDTGKCNKGRCKIGKCSMMAEGANGPRCLMMAKESESSGGKMCCASHKCPMHTNSDHPGNCCCGHMIDPEKPGV